VSVTVTTSPPRLTRLIPELWPGKGGKLIVFTVPNPVACAVWNIGVKTRLLDHAGNHTRRTRYKHLRIVWQDDGVSGITAKIGLEAS